MKFTVPEILTVVLIATVIVISLFMLVKYLIRYAVKFYTEIKGDDLK